MPIDDFPAEVLGEVFLALAPDYLAHVEVGQEKTLDIVYSSHVCHAWRENAISFEALWRNVYIHIPARTTLKHLGVLVDRAHVILERSGSMEVSVTLVVDYMEAAPIIMAVVQAYARKIRRLWFVGSKETLASLRDQWPALVSLYLDVKQWGTLDPVPFQKPFLQSARLQEFAGPVLRTYMLGKVHLSTLTILNFGSTVDLWPARLMRLKATPALEVCRVALCDNEGGPHHHPDAYSQERPCVSLHRLRAMSLIFRVRRYILNGFPDPLQPFFRLLTLPALDLLEIPNKWYDGDPRSDLEDLFARSGKYPRDIVVRVLHRLDDMNDVLAMFKTDFVNSKVQVVRA
ncbi:hypothetical protein B0H11DRAFT_2255690 [Mycena galericulata]|nr:hypothetical protein B0H11DRAFT_2255690 [Mycena galericulata]